MSREDIPRQDGRLALVTGTGGLGFEAAVTLACAGADLVLAGRNAAAGAEAVAKLAELVPAARVRFEHVDLARLASVNDLARRLEGEDRPIDILLCNAGVMSPPERRTTADGFELQFGVNYLAHFALTARLLSLLRRADAPRVVSVTSLAHRYGKIDSDDLQSERSYQPGRAYCASKLAQALFAVELQRRSDAGRWGVTSVAAHPGFARTNLFKAQETKPGALKGLGPRIAGAVVGHSAEAGAAPLVHAATAPDVVGGELYGPKGLLEMRGRPGRRNFAANVLDPETAARLWNVSEALAGVSFAGPAAPVEAVQ